MGPVSAVTRERVQAAASALGYQANSVARSMITGTTHTIGVVLSDLENPFFYKAVRGITDTARERGYQVILANTDEDLAIERTAVTVLAQRRVDGLVVCPTDAEDRAHLQSVIASGTPIVLLDRRVAGLTADTVGIDNRAAAKMATNRLIRAGHRKIAVLTGGAPLYASHYHRAGMKGVERLTANTSGPRAAGYRDALLEAGLPLRPEYVVVNGFHQADAATATRQLLNLTQPPTAILAFDSIMSLGVLQAFRDLDVRCPQDVSLIGFDDAEWAQVVSPALTVVAQPVYEIGSTTIDLLLQRIAGTRRGVVHKRLPTVLIERGSVGPPGERPPAP